MVIFGVNYHSDDIKSCLVVRGFEIFSFELRKFFQDVIAGVVVVQSKSDVAHQGVTLTMEGTVSLQLSAKSVGLFEAFYNSLKVLILINP